MNWRCECGSEKYPSGITTLWCPDCGKAYERVDGELRAVPNGNNSTVESSQCGPVPTLPDGAIPFGNWLKAGSGASVSVPAKYADDEQLEHDIKTDFGNLANGEPKKTTCYQDAVKKAADHLREGLRKNWGLPCVETLPPIGIPKLGAPYRDTCRTPCKIVTSRVWDKSDGGHTATMVIEFDIAPHMVESFKRMMERQDKGHIEFDVPDENP